jgi:DNA-binding response OmpR family regulator
VHAKILIVDDEPDVGEILRRYLEEKGYRATALETAEDALALAAKDAFDAILIDNSLPGMTGMRALEKLKTMTPVVILITGHYDEDVRRDALLLGAYAALPKPFDLPALDAILKESLTRRRGTGPS